ncbi:MAG: restriction endonuclease [Planctomycetota bacterium]
MVASRDGLGLEAPRIRVEVKHRPREKIGAPAVRSFIGSLRSSNRGIYVSTAASPRRPTTRPNARTSL